eukprot:TRINITY_DN26192_c0_g1_i1.p1 TRINITY_DN26192_c0_g1~~TRINITY_DN26192_c0_g1_i1.p1  ORF type:complete len:342 (+),score=41.15 TRINITY_DN26192_c0_g1_i1:73-1026(+)
MDAGVRRRLVAGADAFGATLKEALVEHAREKGIEVVDLGSEKYYSVAEEVAKMVQSAQPGTSESGSGKAANVETRGLVCCGTGMGVTIIANKYPGVYAALCDNVETAINSRAINNSNVLTLGGNQTSPEVGKEIFDAWLATEFLDTCPASGNEAWKPELHSFLQNSLKDLAVIGQKDTSLLQENGIPGQLLRPEDNCVICNLASEREFSDMEKIPGCKWQVLHKNPTAAVVRFAAGASEPVHHHTFGHNVFVSQGNKVVYNVSKGVSHELGPGDYLYTPAGDKHRVEYLTNCDFFISWDGPADIILDDVEPATKEGA